MLLFQHCSTHAVRHWGLLGGCKDSMCLKKDSYLGTLLTPVLMGLYTSWCGTMKLWPRTRTQWRPPTMVHWCPAVSCPWPSYGAEVNSPTLPLHTPYGSIRLFTLVDIVYIYIIISVQYIQPMHERNNILQLEQRRIMKSDWIGFTA